MQLMELACRVVALGGWWPVDGQGTSAVCMQEPSRLGAAGGRWRCSSHAAAVRNVEGWVWRESRSLLIEWAPGIRGLCSVCVPC